LLALLAGSAGGCAPPAPAGRSRTGVCDRRRVTRACRHRLVPGDQHCMLSPGCQFFLTAFACQANAHRLVIYKKRGTNGALRVRRDCARDRADARGHGVVGRGAARARDARALRGARCGPGARRACPAGAPCRAVARTQGRASRLACTGPPACAGRLLMPRQGAGRWFAGRARARERRRSSLGRLAGARRRR